MNGALALDTLLPLIPDFIRAVADAHGFSALSPTLGPILNTAANLIAAGEAGAGELAALTAHVRAMVAAGTDPTSTDWEQLQARSDAAHALIQGTPA